MAATLNIEITGNKILTDLYSSEELTVLGKCEKEFYSLTDTDSWQSVPISKIGTINKIIANVALTTTGTTEPSGVVKVTYDNGSGTVSIPINSMFVWGVPSNYASSITAIDIMNGSSTPVDLSIIVVGE